MMTVLAHFDGRAIVPDEPLDLSENDLLEVTISVRPRPATTPPPGSPAAVLAAVRAMPHLTRADVDEMERLIDEGKSPAQTQGIFDDVAE